MGNILSYLKEQGNTPLTKSAFNEVDNLVLCQLSYVDLEGIVAKVGAEKTISVKDASEAFFDKYSGEKILASNSLLRTTPLILRSMAKSPRFKNAKLSNYVNQISEDAQKQFAAMHVELEDGTVYVAFRGTDDNLVSWREAFNLSYKIVPSQVEAARYLNCTMSDSDKLFYLGGHSKGGNLAIYSAVNCPDNMRNRIIKIFNNDGPGFNRMLLQSDGYEKVIDKITRYTPEFSLIGSLLEHRGPHKIVGNRAKGLKQHDCMTWQVEGAHFQLKDSLSKDSFLLNKSINRWINELKLPERKAFVSSMFDMLSAKGVMKITDISDIGTKNLLKAVGKMARLNKPTRYALGVLAVSFLAIHGREMINPVMSIMNNINIKQ